MIRFRTRMLAVLLFGLLSLGQAYPFAVAWGLETKNHPCCCSSEVAKPCDCNHSGQSKKFSCHSERQFGYSPAPCGAKTEYQSLNFRGELCLPHFTHLIFVLDNFTRSDPLRIDLLDYQPIPESPPPKV